MILAWASPFNYTWSDEFSLSSLIMVMLFDVVAVSLHRVTRHIFKYTHNVYVDQQLLKCLKLMCINIDSGN